MDKIADRVTSSLGRTIFIRKFRKSQVLTAFAGATGYSLFTAGVVKITANLAGWESPVTGILLMTISGFLLRNLWR